MRRFILYGIPKSFLIKIIIALLIIFGCTNVFASNTNVSNKIKYSTSSSKGTYSGDEIYLGGYNGQFSVGTRYNGRLSMVSFYLSTDDYNFTTNHTYTITLNMATEDWRNNFMGPQVANAQSNGTLGASLSVSNFRFVSYKQVKFNFKTSGTLTPYLFFRLYSTDYASTNNVAITGTNNWNLSSIYINDNVSSTPTPAPVTPAPTPTPQPNNQDIINNATQNTQDIINNQNNNTSSIMENNDKNTTDIIENANSNAQAINDTINNAMTNACPNMIKTLNTSIYSGCSYSPTLLSVTCSGFNSDIYFSIVSLTSPTDDIYTLSFNASGVGTSNIYYYIDGNSNNRKQLKDGVNTITIPKGQSLDHGMILFDNYGVSENTTVSFTNFILTRGSDYVPWCLYGSQVSKLDDTNQAINNLNDTMKNDNVDSGTGSDFFNDFDSQDNGGISGIITKPLVLINSLLSNNSSCNNLTFGIKFPNMENKNVSLPSGCILWNNVPNNVVSIYHIFIVGFCSYYLLRRLFKDVEDLKNPEKDNVEVIDL